LKLRVLSFELGYLAVLGILAGPPTGLLRFKTFSSVLLGLSAPSLQLRAIQPLSPKQPCETASFGARGCFLQDPSLLRCRKDTPDAAV
jgi:hypothetical protein